MAQLKLSSEQRRNRLLMTDDGSESSSEERASDADSCDSFQELSSGEVTESEDDQDESLKVSLLIIPMWILFENKLSFSE